MGLQLCAVGVLLGALQFSSGVNLVEVYATVTDGRGRVLTDLARDEFEIYEDGQLQAVSAFTSGEFPLSVALAIDRSWSMAGQRFDLARAAARAFLAELRPGDQSMLIAIGSEVEVLAALSGDRRSQVAALNSLQPWGTTSLYDAIIAAVETIQPAQGRRALILLSDGDDRYSRASAAETLEDVRRADVMIFPIALGKLRPELFAELAALTGGRSFHLRDPRRLTATFRAIAEDLRHQYLLGYPPVRSIVPGTGEWRAIELKVKRPGVRVRARNGYFVP